MLKLFLRPLAQHLLYSYLCSNFSLLYCMTFWCCNDPNPHQGHESFDRIISNRMYYSALLQNSVSTVPYIHTFLLATFLDY